MNHAAQLSSAQLSSATRPDADRELLFFEKFFFPLTTKFYQWGMNSGNSEEMPAGSHVDGCTRDMWSLTCLNYDVWK